MIITHTWAACCAIFRRTSRRRAGEICHVVGEFPNPEEVAYGRNGLPKKMLYRVRFQQAGIWPDYAGGPKDTLEIEVYDHWLMPARTKAASHKGSPRMSHNHSHAHSHGPAAKDHDDRLTYWRAMEIALRKLLIEKGILTADSVRSAVEAMDSRTPENGARLVARAWSDPAFKARLLTDGSAAAGEMGFEVGTLKLMVIENTPAVHNAFRH